MTVVTQGFLGPFAVTQGYGNQRIDNRDVTGVGGKAAGVTGVGAKNASVTGLASKSSTVTGRPPNV